MELQACMEFMTWIQWNLSFRYICFHEKTHFLILAGNAFHQIWSGREPLIIFGKNALPANITKFFFSWNITRQNYKFAWNTCHVTFNLHNSRIHHSIMELKGGSYWRAVTMAKTFHWRPIGMAITDFKIRTLPQIYIEYICL